MSSLLNEYRYRHKADFVWASNDGVCFFDQVKGPGFICTVSDSSRSLFGCKDCSTKNTTMVCEISTLKNKNAFDIFHQHILPDVDLFKLIKDIDINTNPVIVRHQRDVEAWLWRFYLKSDPPELKVTPFKNILRKNKSLQNVVEQILWVCHFSPSVYKIFHDRFYQKFLIGRNYLMTK